ncbi:MAG: hypothetical protein E6I56_12540 [Chloroflexi bacterium]|nr:MAG: hypothetical protein E6I56_12540 [Chloroflexota bacterium]
MKRIIAPLLLALAIAILGSPAVAADQGAPPPPTGGGGQTGGGGGGQIGGPPGPLGFSSFCQGYASGGAVFPGQRDSCDLMVSFGSMPANSSVTFAIFVAITGGFPSYQPIGCRSSGADVVQSSGTDSCTFGFPNGATGGAIIGTESFRAPFSSAPYGEVHLSARINEGTQSYSSGASMSGPGSVISPDPAPDLQVQSLAATEGQEFSGTVATFSDSESFGGDDGGAVCANSCPAGPSQYAAIINWGDGTASGGDISGSSVSGSHVYAEEGSYTVTVGLRDFDTSYNQVSATGSATVSDAALAASGRTGTVASTNPVSTVVASFSDADPNGALADYTASIDWGDSTSPSAGTIAPDGSQFDVSGSHEYAALGPYQVNVHVCDVGGSCADATSSLLVYGTSDGGNFVIADTGAIVPSSVTFWGAGWAPANSLSGGPAPAEFKGFADNPNAPPSCGTGWSSRPGNSANPPATIPSYMAVLVASGITRNEAQINGDTLEVVVVKTDPTYGPDPSQPGTGTIVGILCS